MDAMQNESANAQAPQDQQREQEQEHGADEQQGGTGETAPSGQAEHAADQAGAEVVAAAGAEAEVDVTDAAVKTADPDQADQSATAATVAEVPQPRSAESESSSGKGKKRKAAPKSKSAAGTKSLVVFRDGKVHYSDETVVVLDLDEAAHPDTDVLDVVDKLSELRDAIESAGRTEAVSLVAELIQAKALS